MSEIINTLLRDGHSYDAVYNDYSLDEIRIYYAKIIETNLEETRNNAVIMFNATRGDPKGFKRMIGAMDKQVAQSESKRRRVKTPGQVGNTLFAGLSKLAASGRKG